ncbi:hypothetical protein [Chitinophaga pinensis]|uniref:hypothetical protein n=1 Tax=Chitinophaga pinensis TaxID=79329 RepID=UPI00019E41DF|nr:hypothetical protein [Chitinophaga pinensis]
MDIIILHSSHLISTYNRYSRWQPWTNSVPVDVVLRKSADDYGAPGKDPYFGYGQINAGKAVSLVK